MTDRRKEDAKKFDDRSLIKAMENAAREFAILWREALSRQSQSNSFRIVVYVGHERGILTVKGFREMPLWLIAEMGGKCSYCPETDPSKMEFHHKDNDRDWDPSRTARWVRLARYRREWKAGRVVLACRSCNAKRIHVPDTGPDLEFLES